jgi:hypothetical protein
MALILRSDIIMSNRPKFRFIKKLPPLLAPLLTVGAFITAATFVVNQIRENPEFLLSMPPIFFFMSPGLIPIVAGLFRGLNGLLSGRGFEDPGTYRYTTERRRGGVYHEQETWVSSGYIKTGLACSVALGAAAVIVCGAFSLGMWDSSPLNWLMSPGASVPAVPVGTPSPS